MSTLNDRQIRELLADGKLKLSPLIEDNIQPGSIDLTLGNVLDVPSESQRIDLAEKADRSTLCKQVDLAELPDGYCLHPGRMVIGHSREEIHLPQDVNGLITNRNSLVYAGVNAALTQYINPGFHGNKIIAIANIGPHELILKQGIRICTLILFRMDGNSERSYDRRHAVEDFQGSDKLKKLFAETQSHLDTSLSDYMNRRIREVARDL